MNSRRRWRGRGLSDEPFLTCWTVFKNGTMSGKARYWKTGSSQVRYQLDFIGDRSPIGDLPVRDTATYRFRGHVAGRDFVVANPNGNSHYFTVSGGIPLDQHWNDYNGSLYSRYFPYLDSSAQTDFGLKAMTDLTTQFPEEISILNFLYELRELPGMLLQVGQKVYQLMRRYPGCLSPKSLLSLKGGSEAYLAWEFGWKPLLADLATIWTITSTVKKRLDFLRKTQFGVFEAHSGRDLDAVPGSFVSSRAVNLNSMGGELLVRRTSYRHVLRAHCRVQNNLAYLDEMQGLLRAILGTLGMTNPAKVVWNAMPFSFIVDWCLNVSSWLTAKLNVQDITGDWAVDRVTWSYKTVSEFEVLLTSALTGPIQLGEFTGECYRRFVGLPISTGSITLPTAKQASLLAALLKGSNRY